MRNDITIVTGIWDIKRDQAGDGFKRDFEHYKDRFIKLLNLDIPMVIYIEDENKDWVLKERGNKPTKVYIKPTSSFVEDFPFYNKVQEIRKSKEWIGQVGWLKDSAQGSLELYNPLVMSKMFMLHDASINDPFNTEYFIWVDGGIANTVSPGYFEAENVLDNLIGHLGRFFFICFPYETKSEIHGFNIEGMNRYANTNVNRVARGGIFGGRKSYISKANSIYFTILRDTLNSGLMGTEESIFTLMTYINPRIFSYDMIDSDGLLYSFFERCKKKDRVLVDLYILSFNAPEQFSAICDSLWNSDKNFINSTNKYLLNNSTDQNTFLEYERLCSKWKFTEIKKGNLGICGGRQFIAEHFSETDSDYMLFFEDDMIPNGPSESHCSLGFRKYIPGLFSKSLEIVKMEDYDYLKLCFTEFFGDNSEQWAWYNLPKTIRSDLFPDFPNRVGSLTGNGPRTNFNNIRFFDDLAYIDGDIYYSNWPQIVSKSGNKRMFLDTKWANPYEQVWMSHFYQMTVKNEIRPAVLLLSPITHERFKHYHRGQRKEN